MMPFITNAPFVQVERQEDETENCIARIAAGDRSALAVLYRQTNAAVYGFALSVLKNRQDAEDVLQDTYLRIWNTAGSYTPQGKPLAWIFTIARNLSLMRIRERSHTAAPLQEDWQSSFADEPAVSQEDRIVLASVMKALSDQERQIVTLHAMAGFKHREIAELLDLPLATVLSRYSRALKKLRKALEEAN